MTSDVQDLINTLQDLNALLASHYNSLSADGIDDFHRVEIQDNIQHTLDNIMATQASLNAALAGVNAEDAAAPYSDAVDPASTAGTKSDVTPGYKIYSDAVDPAPTAGTKSDIPPGYKTPTKMVGLNSGAVNPRTGTLMKLSDLRGASTSLIVAPNGGELWHDCGSQVVGSICWV
jgi:hypothetical protein